MWLCGSVRDEKCKMVWWSFANPFYLSDTTTTPKNGSQKWDGKLTNLQCFVRLLFQKAAKVLPEDDGLSGIKKNNLRSNEAF